MQRVRYADHFEKSGRAKDGEALLLEVAEENQGGLGGAADLYALEGDLRKAVELLDKAIAANPVRHDEWFFSRADFLLELGEIEEAEKTLQIDRGPRRSRDDSGPHGGDQGRPRRGSEMVRGGDQAWPDNPDAHYLAGQRLRAEG